MLILLGRPITIFLVLISVFSSANCFSGDYEYSEKVFNSEIKSLPKYRVSQGEYFINMGEYQMAINKLRPVLFGNNGEVNLKTLSLLMKAHWYLGDDKVVIDLSEYLPSKDEARVWHCRILERNESNQDAHYCWKSISEVTRSRRALRSEIILDTFYE